MKSITTMLHTIAKVVITLSVKKKCIVKKSNMKIQSAAPIPAAELIPKMEGLANGFWKYS